MKAVLICLVVLLSGCTIVPTATAHRACYLLDIAIQESTELGSGWYIAAGDILEKCGDETGKARAEFTACFADKSQPAARCLEEKAP